MINLPVEFLERMKADLGDEFGEFLKSYDRPAEKGLRVNTLKISVEDFSALAPVGLDGSVKWEKCGFYATGDVGKTIFHAAGLYYVQEPSAMCAVPKLDINAGERVLDLCAAPGGKSTQIAQYMAGKGVLVANEIDFKRHLALKSNIERLGVRNAAVTCQSPENLANYYANYFDKILVDAPCSGEGMFKKEEAAVREWSPKNVLSCAARQAKILESAHKMLSVGGRIVYSTCTFAPEEDERQIENFLKLHREYKLIETDKLLPHRVRGEGHFFAVLDKTDGERREDFHQIFTEKRHKNLPDLQDFGVKSTRFHNITTIGESVYSLINNFPAELKAGAKLGEYKNDRFEPAHALAMCLTPEEIDGIEVDEKTATDYLRGLTFNCSAPNGWRVVTHRGYALGWCKVVNGTAKNHLPKGLRI